MSVDSQPRSAEQTNGAGGKRALNRSRIAFRPGLLQTVELN